MNVKNSINASIVHKKSHVTKNVPFVLKISKIFFCAKPVNMDFTIAVSMK
jgi:hypothetical protein